jgi:hypothetical protein
MREGTVSKVAQLIVADAPELGPGAKAYTIDCPYSFTTSAAPAETITELGDDRLARIALFRHGLECRRCDTSALWERLRDAQPTPQEAALIGQEMRRAYGRGLRN